jgi:hypothetical protein
MSTSAILSGGIMFCKFCQFDLGDQTICPQCGASQPDCAPSRQRPGKGNFQDIFPLLFGIGCALAMLILSGLWLSTSVSREQMPPEEEALLSARTEETPPVAPVEDLLPLESSLSAQPASPVDWQPLPLPDLRLPGFDASPAQLRIPLLNRPPEKSRTAPRQRRAKQLLARNRAVLANSALAADGTAAADDLADGAVLTDGAKSTERQQPHAPSRYPAKRDPALEGLKWIESLRWLG